MQHRWVSLLVAACGVLAARADVMDVLRQTPRDAGVVVVVPQIDKLASAVAEFGSAIKEETIANWTTRSFLERFELLGATAGIKRDGAIVVVDYPLRGSCILCEVDDVAAWRSGNSATELENGTLRFGEFVDSRAVIVNDRILIIAESDDDLTALRDAIGSGHAELLKAFATDKPPHLSVLANVEPWRMYARPMLMVARNSMAAGMQAAGQQGTAAALEFWNVAFDTVAELFDESQFVRADVRVGAAGVAVNVTMTFADNGTAAGYLRHANATKGDLLRGLPDLPAPLMFAAEWERGTDTPCFSALLVKSMAETVRPQDAAQQEKFDRAMELNQEMYKLVTGYNAMIGLGDGEAGIVSCGVNLTQSPEAVRAKVVESYELSPELMNAFTTGVSAKTEHDVVEGTDGKRVDVFKLQFNSEDEQMRKALQSIYGKGTTVMIAAADEGAVYSIGPEAEARKSLTKLIDGSAEKLAANSRVTALREKLPSDAAALVMIDIPRATGYLYSFARRFGADLPPMKTPPPGEELAGVGVYFGETDLRLSAFVPAEGIRSFIGFVGQLREQKQRQSQ